MLRNYSCGGKGKITKLNVWQESYADILGIAEGEQRVKETADTERRLNFGHFIDRVFWGILVASALYVSSKISEMSHSIEALNQTVAVILQQNTESHDRLNKLDVRLDRLEDRFSH